MKKVYLVFSVVLLFTVNFGFAQMGSQGMSESMMVSQKGEMGKSQMMQKGMMNKEQMMTSMLNTMNQMSKILGNLPSKMKNIRADKMKTMSGLMKDMSTQMMEISRIMAKGSATENEMRALQDNAAQMQIRMTGIIGDCCSIQKEKYHIQASSKAKN
jgi:hypothetical protein